MRLSELSIRVIVAVFGIPLLLFCTFVGGGLFFVLVAGIALLSLRELARLFAPGKGAGPIFWIGSTGAIALLLDAWLWGGADWSWIMLAATGTIMIVEVFRRDPQPVMIIGGTITSWLYLAVPLAHLVWLRGSPGILGMVEGSGPWLVVALWLMVWSSDTAAYFIGLTWGQRRLFSSVSPNKTWEGTIAGLLTAGLAGLLVSTLLPVLSWDPVVGFLIGLVIGLAGIAGDLVESRLKRGAGVKDTGTILPGHGGLLDRFDSMLFCAPALYYLLFV